MMEERNLTCIRCPIGCALRVELDSGRIIRVQGHTCARGESYAEKECTNPTRTITSTVPITGGELRMLPVRTASDIPKEKIFACMEALAGLTINAPVSIGDIILPDVAGTGVSIIATRDVHAIT